MRVDAASTTTGLGAVLGYGIMRVRIIMHSGSFTLDPVRLYAPTVHRCTFPLSPGHRQMHPLALAFVL